jgi:hypothetical protein
MKKISKVVHSNTDKNWLQTYLYLNGRQQLVCIDGAHSQVQVVKNDVPQGSVLGPLLFLLDINDIMLLEVVSIPCMQMILLCCTMYHGSSKEDDGTRFQHNINVGIQQ